MASSDSSEQSNQRSTAPFLDDFPDATLQRIFNYLPLIDRLRLESISSRWNTLLRKSWDDVDTLIVWRQGIYESDRHYLDASDPDPRSVIRANPTSIYRLLLKINSNLRSFKLIQTSAIDQRVFDTLLGSCTNLEELEVHHSVFPLDMARTGGELVSNILADFKSLKSIAWNRNRTSVNRSDGEEDEEQQQILDSSSSSSEDSNSSSSSSSASSTEAVNNIVDEINNGGLRTSPFPSLSGMDSFTSMRAIRRLHLEDTPMLWGNFIYVCVHLAPTLEEFCYKLWDHYCIPLRCTVSRGLQHLINLRQLNLGGDRTRTRPLGGLIDDDFALFISCTLTKLERISFKASERLGGKGVRALLRNLKYLTYLNLNQCDLVNNSVLESAMEQRTKEKPYLIVYASDTEVETKKLYFAKEDEDRITVLTDPRFVDETVFYGEPKFEELSC